MLEFYTDWLTTAQVIVGTRLKNGFCGHSLATDYWIVSMFELNLKNTVLRSLLEFHTDQLTTAQVIVGTGLKKWVFWV
jgi:hypothetical protein